MPTYHEVYLAEFPLAMQDPDMPQPRYHTTIFVKTNPDNTGTIHHVTGDVTSAAGMSYTPRPHDPLEPLHSLERLGVTPAAAHPHEWEKLLSSLPTPLQQKAFNVKTMKTEPFKTKDPLTFYETGEERRPLVKCTEWVLERALPALKESGLLIEG
ncbi:hypothetical protein BJY04DRAFT_222617 [Aspergillus karnatakaensis]|uniref:uncharacterized protein n=1 Tax=Aspergillus karnatakaensis TaxID=1810916 RepID=UPI003CCCFC97